MKEAMWATDSLERGDMCRIRGGWPGQEMWLHERCQKGRRRKWASGEWWGYSSVVIPWCDGRMHVSNFWRRYTDDDESSVRSPGLKTNINNNVFESVCQPPVRRDHILDKNDFQEMPHFLLLRQYLGTNAWHQPTMITRSMYQRGGRSFPSALAGGQVAFQNFRRPITVQNARDRAWRHERSWHSRNSGCGSANIPSTSTRRSLASSSSSSSIPYPRAAVAITVQCTVGHQHYYLLIQRGKEPDKGKWYVKTTRQNALALSPRENSQRCANQKCQIINILVFTVLVFVLLFLSSHVKKNWPKVLTRCVLIILLLSRCNVYQYKCFSLTHSCNTTHPTHFDFVL